MEIPYYIGGSLKCERHVTQVGQKTKHSVVYWLNPMQQDENNYGIFTVEELEQWMEGKGPIPKKA